MHGDPQSVAGRSQAGISKRRGGERAVGKRLSAFYTRLLTE